jgi:DNA repair ATPase RecN
MAQAIPLHPDAASIEKALSQDLARAKQLPESKTEMDAEINRTLESICTTVKNYCDAEISRRARELDEKLRFLEESVERMERFEERLKHAEIIIRKQDYKILHLQLDREDRDT